MNDKTKPAPKAGKTRTKSTPETAKSVNLSLHDDEEVHAKLLNILHLCQKNNKGIHIPLSGALRFAVNAAHTNIFGEEFDEDPSGAFDAFLERLEQYKSRPRPRPAPQERAPEPPRQSASAEGGKTPGQIAREAAESKSDAERGIGKPPAPKT